MTFKVAKDQTGKGRMRVREKSRRNGVRRATKRARSLEHNPIVGNLGEPRRSPGRRTGSTPVLKAGRKLIRAAKRTLKRVTF
jgi:hypothetical protein